jgi:hypothetical protein
LWEAIRGSGRPITGTYPLLVPEIQNPRGHGTEIWVFELPVKNAGAQ